MTTQTLVLDKAYRPHRITPWRDAVTSMLNGKVEVISEYDEELVTLDRKTLDGFPEFKTSLRHIIGTMADSITIKVPAVVVNRSALVKITSGAKYGKRNIYIRDSYTCQYCNAKPGRLNLNLDHVLPRTQGGKTTWENIVTSCRPCNSDKGGRTPEQAGMKLRRQPSRPNGLPIAGPYIEASRAPTEWVPFL